MAKFINGRWLTDAELYPEQFEDLPEEAEPKVRKHSVRLSDIGEDGGEGCGKSPEKSRKSAAEAGGGVKGTKTSLASLLGGTAPSWKRSQNEKDTVNPQENDLNNDSVGRDNDETVEEIYSKKRRDTAKAYAMKIVAMGAVTEQKLRDKMKTREYSDEEIEEAIAYVKSFGYVNDEKLAQDMIEKLAARMWGRFKICYYLKGKGISEDVIEDLDFSEIDFPFYCAQLMKKYGPERREAMLRAVKNAGYSSDDLRRARALLNEDE